jgi:hypothetical protein
MTTVGLRASFRHRNSSIISQGQDIKFENRDHFLPQWILDKLSAASSGILLNAFVDLATLEAEVKQRVGGGRNPAYLNWTL